MSEVIEIKGLDERIKELGELSVQNPEMRRRINDVIRSVLLRVRKRLSVSARSGLGMQSDPRSSYRAVRSAVYRRIFGGQVNLLPSRRAGEGWFYAPPRKLDDSPHQRGGNRLPRSERTLSMMSYAGRDRGMILRWLNDGTYKQDPRTSRYGNRGSLQGAHWFGQASHAELEQAAVEIDKMINDILTGKMY